MGHLHAMYLLRTEFPHESCDETGRLVLPEQVLRENNDEDGGGCRTIWAVNGIWNRVVEGPCREGPLLVRDRYLPMPPYTNV